MYILYRAPKVRPKSNEWWVGTFFSTPKQFSYFIQILFYELPSRHYLHMTNCQVKQYNMKLFNRTQINFFEEFFIRYWITNNNTTCAQRFNLITINITDNSSCFFADKIPSCIIPSLHC